MDKLKFDNGVAGPPTKRQKISTETPSIVTTTQPDNPAKMDHQKTHLAIVDNGFQPERESQVGILCFVNNSNPGFSGTLKQRYVSGCPSPDPLIFGACFILSILPDAVPISFETGHHNWDGLLPRLGWLLSPSCVPTMNNVFGHHSINLSPENPATSTC